MFDITIVLLLIFLIIIVTYYKLTDKVNENFLDLYSYTLHKNASEKEIWWDLTHRKRYFDDPQYDYAIYK